ncbi:hypothetical protein MYCTH_95272 [Thermothelomyces thermophilus ATCC 42464]|uniref:MYND-type domain-containing protein n=1 Tax=Thermothelomyces thermophilus (strain ATCC 42464 / BCRC 31852 / DSM 1799) TaxID=573729 RepID=G2QGR7_THET4|nr:uncharacterized protein MYCTH_95272 [Thermothelomyces thermophilus ATCC 42464]AEO58629.1 hypothetical protein MYCTH_95272 [Thermothelomyces thermophilus ATCC 42464]
MSTCSLLLILISAVIRTPGRPEKPDKRSFLVASVPHRAGPNMGAGAADRDCDLGLTRRSKSAVRYRKWLKGRKGDCSSLGRSIDGMAQLAVGLTGATAGTTTNGFPKSDWLELFVCFLCNIQRGMKMTDCLKVPARSSELLLQSILQFDQSRLRDQLQPAVAMLTPGYANLWVHFYPIGNTPAVFLTQGLPPEKDANILLLGCGDVRNIFFTVHSDGSRRMDITCCDIEPAIIATRNVLLVTLILDDSNGQWNNDNWDLYHHVFINKACHDRLQKQAKKLHTLATSFEAWREGDYGNLVAFCDRGTLTRVAEVWAFYISTATERQSWMKKTFKTAIETRNRKRRGTGVILSGLRSATPAGMLAGLDLNELHDQFWKHGTVDMDHMVRSQATYANPLFVSPDSTPRVSKLEDVVAAARAELCTWSDTFRGRGRENVRLRFFAGDAIPFCYTLQNRRATGFDRTVCWYRSRHTSLDPLVLVEDDYGTDGTAPVSFNVIDTSNLIDHVGGLNLLTAASPLLDGDASSSLYTETLVQRKRSYQEQLDEILGGHLPTSSLLLGLFPVEYWTNTCPSSIGDEQLMGFIQSLQQTTVEPLRQLYSRITWKRPPCSSASHIERLHMDDEQLASLLYRVYVDMFPGENIGRMFSMATMNPESILHASLPTYTRASFVSFLVLVKKRIVASWDRAMDILLARIESNRTHLIGCLFLQELYLYMHLLDIHSVDTFKSFAKRDMGMGTAPKGAPSIAHWQDMPSSVCITLKVPRSALRVFTDPDFSTVGTIPVHGVVRDSSGGYVGWENYFAAVQLGFGSLSPSGIPFSNAFELVITEDYQGWHGNCPLFVSFRVPSWMLLLEPRTAIVGFCMQSTPTTASRFIRRLGVDLCIFKTNLGDTNHVYISKDLPNQAGTIVVAGFAKDAFASPAPENSEVRTTVSVTINPNTARIACMTARLDVVSDALKSALLGSCPVQSTTTSPCTFTITINKTPVKVTFPVPVVAESYTMRIARKSAYIELIAIVMPNPAVHPSATFTSPLLFSNCPDNTNDPVPILWNTPQISLPTAPVISLCNPRALSFLSVHTDQMFSTREARLRNNPILLAAATRPERARIALKESLHCLFMQFAGLNSNTRNPASPRRESIFALHNPNQGEGGGGVNNAHLPLDPAPRPRPPHRPPRLRRAPAHARHHARAGTPRLPGGRRGPARRGGGIHHGRCGRAKAMEGGAARVGGAVSRRGVGAPGRMAPVSVDMGEEVVCGCGKGVFPAGWEPDVPMWEVVKRFCVRAAISPLFASVLVEDVMPDVEPFGPGLGQDGRKEKGDGVTGCRSCAREKSKEGGELKAFAKCLKVKYCGRTCQRADWKRHKKECIAKHS